MQVSTSKPNSGILDSTLLKALDWCHQTTPQILQKIILRRCKIKLWICHPALQPAHCSNKTNIYSNGMGRFRKKNEEGPSSGFKFQWIRVEPNHFDWHRTCLSWNIRGFWCFMCCLFKLLIFGNPWARLHCFICASRWGLGFDRKTLDTTNKAEWCKMLEIDRLHVAICCQHHVYMSICLIYNCLDGRRCKNAAANRRSSKFRYLQI